MKKILVVLGSVVLCMCIAGSSNFNLNAKNLDQFAEQAKKDKKAKKDSDKQLKNVLKKSKKESKTQDKEKQKNNAASAKLEKNLISNCADAVKAIKEINLIDIQKSDCEKKVDESYLLLTEKLKNFKSPESVEGSINEFKEINALIGTWEIECGNLKKANDNLVSLRKKQTVVIKKLIELIYSTDDFKEVRSKALEAFKKTILGEQKEACEDGTAVSTTSEDAVDQAAAASEDSEAVDNEQQKNESTEEKNAISDGNEVKSTIVGG